MQETIEIYIDGARYTTHDTPSGRLKSQTKADKRTLAERKKDTTLEIAPPIAGEVVRILAKAGQPVTKGQPLLVIDAMKMENIITAPADGIVSEIRTSERAHAPKGDTIILINKQ